MKFNVFAKLLALSLCSVAVNGLDGVSNEYANEDRISRLSNYIENLKNLLDRSQGYNSNNPRQSLWPNVYNRETDYDMYLRQYYIDPIINTLREISEQVKSIKAANNSPQPLLGQFPGQFATPYGTTFGTGNGWDVSKPFFAQSHGIAGIPSRYPSFSLNENSHSNDTTGSQFFNIEDRIPARPTIQPHELGTGFKLNMANGESIGVANDFGSTLPKLSQSQGFNAVSGSNTQSNGFGALFNLNSPSYAQSHQFGSGESPSYKPFIDIRSESQFSSATLNQSTNNSNGITTPQAPGIEDRFPTFPNTQPPKFDEQAFGQGMVSGSGTSTGFSTVSNSGSYSNTQSHGFGTSFGSNLPSYPPSHQFSFGNAPSNKQFQSSGNTYYSGQSSYLNPYSPSVMNRFPVDDDEDTGKNWGLVDETDDDKDYVRPVSLKSKSNLKPNCDCESYNNKNSKSSPIQLSKTVPNTAATCKAVVLSCCAPGVKEQDRRNCFAAQGCVRSYDTGLACLPVVIRAVYKELYANI